MHIIWLPDDFADDGGPWCSLAGGSLVCSAAVLCGGCLFVLVCFLFVALRCYAEECAFSLRTQAKDHVWASGISLRTSRSNRRTAQPARRPEKQAASENCCGYTTLLILLCARALTKPCPLRAWGVRFRLDLAPSARTATAVGSRAPALCFTANCSAASGAPLQSAVQRVKTI